MRLSVVRSPKLVPRRTWFLVAGILVTAWLSPAAGEPLPLFFQGVRPLGMGGAFTAVADDENAMFYNPAGLNRIKRFGGVELINPLVEAGANAVEFGNDFRDLADTDTDTEQIQLASRLFDKWLGEPIHARASLFPNVTAHNVGIGILAQAVFDGEVHTFTGARALQVRAGYDLAGLASGALGFSVLGGTLQVGATGKVVRRELVDRSYTANDLVQQNGIDFDRDLQTGTGVGVDLGAIYSLPVLLKPSIGVTVQNVGDVDLGDAGILPQQINAGIALRPALPRGLATIAVDVVDATRDLGSDQDWGKRLHAGVEYQFPLALSLRAGLNQGYASVGATIDFSAVKLGYAYTIEEVGAFAGQEPDRRHVAQLSLGF